MQKAQVLVGSVEIEIAQEQWPFARPFHISGHVFETADLVVVTLKKDGITGRGEASGVYYRHETAVSMAAQIRKVEPFIRNNLNSDLLRSYLPPGGARNAIDCALWDLGAKLSGRPAWEILGLEKPRSLLTTFTCGASTPEEMAKTAIGYSHARAIKLKLTGEAQDADRVLAVRRARPDVWLSIDANQGFSPDKLEQLIPTLVGADVSLIEQPFTPDNDKVLERIQCPIPIAADESVQDTSDLERMMGRYQVINIKLDKCGGLTEAFDLANKARSMGFRLMVGNMFGTSLAAAPAFLIGQLCDVVDLDGPVFLKQDRELSVRYHDGSIECPDHVWGVPLSA